MAAFPLRLSGYALLMVSGISLGRHPGFLGCLGTMLLVIASHCLICLAEAISEIQAEEQNGLTNDQEDCS